jgi:hypothetical protein
MNIQIKEKKTFDPVPEGVYAAAEIIEATESADGQYIQMRIDVGSNNGCVFDRLYADNAVRARFICDAIGKTWDGTVSASDLQGKVASIDVSIVEKNGKTFNKILTWKAAESGAAPTPTSPPSKTISDDDIPF